MSEYEKASKGVYFLFLSQIVAIIGGILALVIFSVYAEINLKNVLRFTNFTTVTTGFNFTSSSAEGVFSQMPLQLISGIMNAVLVLIVAGSIVGFVEILLMVYGWKTLSEFNNSEYHTPYIGSVMSMIGFFLVMPLSVFMINAIKGAFVSYQVTQTVPLQIIAVALTALIPIFIGILILLAGYIMMLIGYWRLGSQFNSTLIKAAIILLIITILLSFLSRVFPLLPEIFEIISVLLLTVGLYSVSKKTKMQENLK